MAVNAAEFVQDLKEHQALITPIIEGLEDFRRLNLETEARTLVTQQIRSYQERNTRLLAAIEAVEALIATGYPMLELTELPQGILDELQANMETLAAALATFTAGQAAQLGLAAQPPQPK